MTQPKLVNQKRKYPLKGRLSTLPTGSASFLADYKLISLTQNKFTIVDNEDFERLNQYSWSADKKECTCYAKHNAGKRHILMHREILKAKKGQDIDHINHNGLDNRKCNLRFCTPSQNHRNQKPSKGGTSCYKGVSRHKKNSKWQVHIWLNGKNNYLGCYDNEIKAAKVYDKKALELFGEFACVNISA